MKRKITLLMLAAGSMFSINAQVVFTENFTSPFNPTTAGWDVQNLSASANPTLAWFQGNGANVFPAFNGGPDDYFGCNFNNTSSSTPATISSWLITPSVTLSNGMIVEFATRTTTNPAAFPDRLEVYFSTAGNGTNVGTGPTSLGTFSTLLVSVNPNLTTTGYPGVWTVYQGTITGLAGPTAGRVGFRYHVTNAGPASAAVNSDYIGLDAVKISLPCGITVPSYTICSGASATLNAVGGSAGYTYTWTPTPSNNSSIVVTPASTTAYTLNYGSASGTCPAVSGTVTIGTQLSVSITAMNSKTICAGGSVTLTANSAAASYSWNTGAQTSVITVTPNGTTTYSVAAYNGVFPTITCAGANTIMITVNPNPTLGVAITPTALCDSQGNLTITASGATTYNYLNSTSNPQSLATPSAGVWNFALSGTTNGCTSMGVVVFTVNPNPTITVVSTTNTACTNATVTLTASGADTYAWAGAATSINNPLTFPTGGTAGPKVFTVTGTDANTGCMGTRTFTQNVVLCNLVGIPSIGGSEETSVFPNPFTTEIKIHALDGNVVIYNALGQVVISTAVHSSETINTTELPKGAYLVKAYDSNGELVKTSKLIKN